MKKVLLIVIAFSMCISLFGCNLLFPKAETGVPSYTVKEPAKSTADAPASSDITKAGYFDPAVDYSQNRNYKVAYLMNKKTGLNAAFSKAFEAWAYRMNVSYDDFDADGDNEVYLSQIQNCANMYYDGLLLDPDSTIFPRLSEMLDELNIPWMSCMAPPLAEDFKTLLHPYVGFDNVQAGVAMAKFNIDYAKTTWPDAEPEEIGAIFIGYSVVPALAQREQGFKATFLEAYPESADNYIFCDGVEDDMSYQTGFNLVSPVFAARPDIKYWLISGFFDDFTDGAAGAAEVAGKADTTVCSTFGGTGLIEKWDTGVTSCWRGAIYTDQRLYAMPIFCGLYAMMDGQNTAEDLWPEWVNHSVGDQYATVLLPTVVITKESYKEYLMWVAEYTGIHQKDYDVPAGNFTATVDVPDYYTSPPAITDGQTEPDGQTAPDGQSAPDGQTASDGQSVPDGQTAPDSQAAPESQTVPDSQTPQDSQTPPTNPAGNEIS